ncbi:MAG: hypothetical protein COS92_03675 [Desulfobacterales bacterium CG07_land_8_20_14_0_80_52_14]|nr:MAG: hypothetical protein COS92_03675 [Desulfobacterales bacterium CG07_land_8_20_14_0_80_52_14]
MIRFLIVLSLLIAVVPAIAQDSERRSLLNEPKFIEKGVKPSFRILTATKVQDATMVVSSRSFAALGFNTPEVQIHLPDLDNSVYAEIEMPKPLLDGGSGYQLEQGLFDAKTRIAEIRFLASDGKSPAEFSRVTGRIHVRYPLEVRTRIISAGQANNLITIDGPYVEFLKGTVAAAPSFSPLEPVRAYDQDGRQLKKAPIYHYRTENDLTYNRFAFHGKVNRVEVDSVLRWVDLDITYDLPPAPKIPEERAGLTPDKVRPVPATPGGKVLIKASKLTLAQPAARQVETTAPAKHSLAPAVSPPQLKPQGLLVPIVPRPKLSADARAVAEGLEALRKVIPQPPAIVEIVAFDRGVVSISVEKHGGKVVSYTFSQGKVTGPEPVDTRWMTCKNGLPPDAVDLDRLPSLWDDAPKRAAAPDAKVMQIVIAQDPCGTVFLNVPVKGKDGVHRVRYTGDGRFLAVQ